MATWEVKTEGSWARPAQSPHPLKKKVSESLFYTQAWHGAHACKPAAWEAVVGGMWSELGGTKGWRPYLKKKMKSKRVRGASSGKVLA